MALRQMSETILPHDKNRIDLHPVPVCWRRRTFHHAAPASRNDFSHVIRQCEIGSRQAGQCLLPPFCCGGSLIFFSFLWNLFFFSPECRGWNFGVQLYFIPNLQHLVQLPNCTRILISFSPLYYDSRKRNYISKWGGRKLTNMLAEGPEEAGCAEVTPNAQIRYMISEWRGDLHILQTRLRRNAQLSDLSPSFRQKWKFSHERVVVGWGWGGGGG